MVKKMRKEFIGRVKYKLEIAVKCLIFMFVYAISGFFRNSGKYRDLWLISERGDDAGDNGYALFCYIRKTYPECNIKYVIRKDAADAQKVKKAGEIIPFGSFEHYLAIILAEVLISTHLLGYTTNDYLFKRFERRGMLKGKRIFLQHGIIKDDIRELYREEAIPDMFVCSLREEADYVVSQFRQPESVVSLIGLCRYDGLPFRDEQKNVKTGTILLMPTWRRSLYFYSGKDFQETPYYKSWQALLSSERMHAILERYHYRLIFYPHHQMQKFAELFHSDSERITIASKDGCGVQELLVHSDVLVTDFSSVFFDYGYMQKPMIYFQFDRKEFREEHYQQGWFSYEKDGFGKVLEHPDEVEAELEKILDRGCTMEPLYRERQNRLFKFHDHNNCERNYREILKRLENGGKEN